MSVEETKCNGDLKLEELSSDGLITYKRRKRTRTDQSSFQQEGASVSAAAEVFLADSGEGKNKDIGWEHGEIVPGNRYHWKCNWCGLVGCSGGVTRLKKHLAGAWHVIRCEKVPIHIARTMNSHLMEMRKKNLKRRWKEHDDVDKTNSECPHPDISVDKDHGRIDLDMQVSNATQQSERTTRRSKTASQQSRDSYQRSKVAAQQFQTDMAKNDHLWEARTKTKLKRGRKAHDDIDKKNSGYPDLDNSQQSRDSFQRSKVAAQRFQTDMAKNDHLWEVRTKTKLKRGRKAHDDMDKKNSGYPDLDNSQQSRDSYQRSKVAAQRFKTDMAKNDHLWEARTKTKLKKGRKAHDDIDKKNSGYPDLDNSQQSRDSYQRSKVAAQRFKTDMAKNDHLWEVRTKTKLKGGIVAAQRFKTDMAKNDHLWEARTKTKLKRGRKAHDDIDKKNSGYPDLDNSQQSRDSYQRSKVAAQRFKTDMAKNDHLWEVRTKTKLKRGIVAAQRFKTDMAKNDHLWEARTKTKLKRGRKAHDDIDKKNSGYPDLDNSQQSRDSYQRSKVAAQRFKTDMAKNDHLWEARTKTKLKRGRKAHDDIDKKNSGYPDLDNSQQSRDSYQRSKAHDDIDKKNSGYPDLDNSICKDYGRIDLEMQVSIAPQQSKGVAERSRAASQRSRASYRRSRTATRRSKTDMVKQDGLARIDSHWRNVLELMLQLPDVREGGGIQSCIRDALIFDPPGFTRKFKMADVPKDTAEPQDRCKSHCEVLGQSLRMDISAKGHIDVSKTGTYDQTDVHANMMKCQDVFLDILRSDKFVLLCNLLCESFQDIKAEKLFDFSLINSKMKKGIYEQSPGLFNQDIQQVWREFQKIGQEMVLLAGSLSNMSRASYQTQVGEDLVHEAGEQKYEDNCQVGSEQKNSNDSYTTTQFPSCESDRSTKPDQTVASCLYKVCTCKQCGTEADGECSLICDGCEAVYHFSCAEPSVQVIPTRSWYCASCIKDKRQSPEHFDNTQQDSLHDNCVVCDRLEVSGSKEHLSEGGRITIANGSRESSVSSMESDRPPEPSRTALSRLCKQCGTCEDEDKRFLVCGHSQCPFKFYHIRCLKSNQMAGLQQQNQRCWYCPSCLCRACLLDKDDDKIVLCDGCDEAYHTYCMKPPRTSIPKGLWYCLQCNVAKAREGMRRYEQLILQQHGKKGVKQANEDIRPMDVLLSAVEKLSSEEHLTAGVQTSK